MLASLGVRSVQSRVNRGVVYLDRKFPDWETYVELENLDMGDSDSCVIAQIFGEYWQGIERLFWLRRRLHKLFGYVFYTIRPAYYGFHAFSFDDLEYARLTTAWKTVITMRQAHARMQKDAA